MEEGKSEHKMQENGFNEGGFQNMNEERMMPRGLTRRSFLGLSGVAVVTVMASSFSLSGCSEQDKAENESKADDSAESKEPKATTRTVTNLDGSSIAVPAEVTSIAAIFGPSYEKLVAVGAEDRISCDGDFHISGWPWSNVIYKYLNDVPGIENAHSDLNIEDLVAQGVQVVFCFPNPDQADAINNAGMCAIPMASTGAFKDIADTLQLYADVIGDEKAAAQAKAYNEYFAETVAMVSERTAQVTERPQVYLAYTDLLHGYGAKSDMVEVIDLAGGVLASIELEGSSNIEVTAEQLIQWNPDYIFVDHAGSSGNASAEDAITEALATGDFGGITAVKNDAVFATPTGVFFWDSGIQKILYLVYIAKTIHPELFEDIDMKELLIDFYEKFFDYQLTDEQATQILNHEDPK